MPPASRRCVGGGNLRAGALHRKDDQVAALGDHAGENVLADKAGARRDHHLGETRTAIEQRLLALPWRRRLAECEVFVGGECGGRLGVSPQQQVIALGDDGSAQRASRFTLLNGDELQFGIGGQLDRRRGHADKGRTCAHAHLVDAAGKAVLLDERLRVAAEVGRHGRAIAFGQEPFSEQYDDRHRSCQQRQADKREFEEAEAAHASVAASVRDQDVHRRTGQSQLRAGMRGKDQRQQQLRRISLQADGDDDHHRQKRGDGAIDADQRREERDHTHRQQQQASPALFARAADQKLPGPGGDAGHVEPGADDEERGYEDHRGITEAAKGLIDRQDAGCPQRQSRSPSRQRRQAACSRRTGRRRPR